MCFTSATLAPDGLKILPTMVTCSFIPCTKGETQASPIISLRFHTAIRYFLHTSFWYTTLTFSKCGLMRSICPRPTLVGMFLKPSSFSMHIACSTVNSSCPQIRCSFWTTSGGQATPPGAFGPTRHARFNRFQFLGWKTGPHHGPYRF